LASLDSLLGFSFLCSPAPPRLPSMASLTFHGSPWPACVCLGFSGFLAFLGQSGFLWHLWLGLVFIGLILASLRSFVLHPGSPYCHPTDKPPIGKPYGWHRQGLAFSWMEGHGRTAGSFKRAMEARRRPKMTRPSQANIQETPPMPCCVCFNCEGRGMEIWK
jgi:hypothetical protein